MTELEQLIKIRDEAPEGATHVDSTHVYLKLNDMQEWESFSWCGYNKMVCWVDTKNPIFPNRDLSDIKTMIEQQERIAELERERDKWMRSSRGLEKTVSVLTSKLKNHDKEQQIKGAEYALSLIVNEDCQGSMLSKVKQDALDAIEQLRKGGE